MDAMPRSFLSHEAAPGNNAWSCIMPGLPMHLVQELYVGTVDAMPRSSDSHEAASGKQRMVVYYARAAHNSCTKCMGSPGIIHDHALFPGAASWERKERGIASTVPTYYSCTKCMGSPGIIHNHALFSGSGFVRIGGTWHCIYSADI